MAGTKNIAIKQGKTFSLVLRWEVEPIVYRAITAIEKTAPVRLTVPAHGIPDGWRVAVTNVKGMVEINAEANNVKDSDYHVATVIDSDTIELNDVNAAGFKSYVSGGFVQFNTPVDLTGYVARLKIKDKVGGLVLASNDVGGIVDVVVNDSTKTITVTIDAVDTAEIAWSKGVYELELESVSGVVTELLTGSVTVTKEVTTS